MEAKGKSEKGRGEVREMLNGEKGLKGLKERSGMLQWRW